VSARLTRSAVVFLVLFGAAQFIRPELTNPAIDASRTIKAQMGATSGLVAVVDRACSDCHSNATAWPWYTKVAPVSWLMAHGVKEGRKVVNFSEWGTYSPDQQRTLLAASCQAVSSGRMPGPYTLVRPETRLSSQDVQTICAAAMKADADVARGR
jgi:hypothetical protein